MYARAYAFCGALGTEADEMHGECKLYVGCMHNVCSRYAKVHWCGLAALFSLLSTLESKPP